MKKQFLTLLLAIFFLSIYGQTDENLNVQELIEKGIELYDAEEYEQSIEVFTEALEIDPTSMIATYELALSYLAINDYENASKFSTKVINFKEEKMLIGA
ncbi:MAG: tetratricopeptide repeat protein, partial [Bacteroidales bacterium]|nr:tetratricopeptide repeat protein [Bacteroidales bacterium]